MSHPLSERNAHLSLEYAILGLLSEHPRSGYDLKTRCFEGTLRPLWNADQAQIYRTLQRLHAARLISSRPQKRSGRPDRLVYDITQAGRQALDHWLMTPAAVGSLKDSFLLQLHFASSLPDEALLRLFEARRAAHQEVLDRTREHAAALAGAPDPDDRRMILRLTAFEGAIARERATVDWLDDCIQAVREGALPGSHDEESASGTCSPHDSGYTDEGLTEGVGREDHRD